MEPQEELDLTRARLANACDMFYCNGPKAPQRLLELLAADQPLCKALPRLLSDADEGAVACVCRAWRYLACPKGFGRRVYFTMSASGSLWNAPPQIKGTRSSLPLFHLTRRCEFESDQPFPTLVYEYKRYSDPPAHSRGPWDRVLTFKLPEGPRVEYQQLTETELLHTSQTLRSWIQVLTAKAARLQAAGAFAETQEMANG